MERRSLGHTNRYFKLEEMLRKMPLDDVAKADLESGEWIWGRGSGRHEGGLRYTPLCLSSMPNRPSTEHWKEA